MKNSKGDMHITEKILILYVMLSCFVYWICGTTGMLDIVRTQPKSFRSDGVVTVHIVSFLTIVFSTVIYSIISHTRAMLILRNIAVAIYLCSVVYISTIGTYHFVTVYMVENEDSKRLAQTILGSITTFMMVAVLVIIVMRITNAKINEENETKNIKDNQSDKK